MHGIKTNVSTTLKSCKPEIASTCLHLIFLNEQAQNKELQLQAKRNNYKLKIDHTCLHGRKDKLLVKT